MTIFGMNSLRPGLSLQARSDAWMLLGELGGWQIGHSRMKRSNITVSMRFDCIRRARQRTSAFLRAIAPVDPETRQVLTARWSALPTRAQTDSQTLGRIAVGCEGTHGVFPRCNFTCTPCYHSREANRVRIDGLHTVREVESQMAFARSVRGPHAHTQLIGGEVSLLDPDDHAEALAIMRRYGREPMSMTHGDFDYSYLKRLALGPDGLPRFKRLSFAGHFDTTMRGRKGLARATDESELNPYRQEFCDMFRRLRKEHGIRFFLAHNVTVTPKNVGAIPQIVRDCRLMGFNMLSFQPAAFVGDERRWKEDYSALGADEIWDRIEEGAGTKLPYEIIQTGDERCNRTAYGYFVGSRWFSVLDEGDAADLEARDTFFNYFGGFNWGAPGHLLMLRIVGIALCHPKLLLTSLFWFRRRLHRAGGTFRVLRAFVDHEFVLMTFVMHRFMHADDVSPAWELLEKGEMSEDPKVRETQERLQSCFYSMAHPETGRLVPACVQHSVLDVAENAKLAVELPLPKVRPRRGIESSLHLN